MIDRLKGRGDDEDADRVQSMKQPTLGVIILNCFNAEDTVIEAEQAIKDLLLSKLPEKRDSLGFPSYDGKEFKYDRRVESNSDIGYNKAIDEFTKIIEGL